MKHLPDIRIQRLSHPRDGEILCPRALCVVGHIPHSRQYALLCILDGSRDLPRQPRKRGWLQRIGLIVALRRVRIEIKCLGIPPQHHLLQHIRHAIAVRTGHPIGRLRRIDIEPPRIDAVFPLLCEHLIRFARPLLRLLAVISLIVARHRRAVDILRERLRAERRRERIDKNDMRIARVLRRRLELRAQLRRFLLILCERDHRRYAPLLLGDAHPVDRPRNVIHRHRRECLLGIQIARLQPLGSQREESAQLPRLHELIRVRLSQLLLVLLDLALIAAELRERILRRALRARYLDEDAVLLQLLRDGDSPLFERISLEHIGEILIRHLQQFDAAAQLLIHGEEDEDRLQHALRIRAQLRLLLIGIEHHADVRHQICSAAHIEKIPELINRQERVLRERPRMIDEVLERLHLIVARRLDEVEHTALIRLKRRRDVLQHQCCHRMERHDALDDLLRGDLCRRHHALPRGVEAAVEIILVLRPLRLRRLLWPERRTDKIERDIVGQGDTNGEEAIAHLFPCLISLREEMSRLMRHGDKEKRRLVHQLCQRLKICQTLTIHTEEIGELIPEEHELDLVLRDDVSQPCLQHIDIQLDHAHPRVI